MTSTIISVEAVFLTAFTGIITASMWRKAQIDLETAAGEFFAHPLFW